jgi:hypothetical protein
VSESPIPVADLERLREAAAAELQAAQRDLASAQRRYEDARERLRLLERLVAVETAPDDGHMPAPALGDALLDACEEIIVEAGQPLHLRDLLASLTKRGVPLPGRGVEANLIVRLQRSNGRFVRVGRGTYAPAHLGLKETRPTRKRRVPSRS